MQQREAYNSDRYGDDGSSRISLWRQGQEEGMPYTWSSCGGARRGSLDSSAFRLLLVSLSFPFTLSVTIG
jgi:hypothetical protein